MFLFLEIYAYGIRIYCRGWIYYRIEWILLILALIECGLEYYDQFIDGHFLSNRVLSILQILIIIQIFRLLRILEVNLDLFYQNLVFFFSVLRRI